MIAVSLKPIFYRYQECMGVYYNNDSLVNGLVRKLNGIKWSQSNKCWYLPLSVDSYQHVYKVLRGKA
ncbi:MAG: hypothetical protein ACXWC7_06920, partial [Chitinophagaceae bacterium]